MSTSEQSPRLKPAAASAAAGFNGSPASSVNGDPGLARRSATGFEVFGQSLAATGPSIAVAGTVAVVY
jgi:hypothetical protein